MMAVHSARTVMALLAICASASCAMQQPAERVTSLVLVTADEYAAAIEGFSSPQAAIDSSRTRQSMGDANGPIVELLAPVIDGKSLTSPVTVEVRWSAQEGAGIDINTVRLVYSTGLKVEDHTSKLKYCKSAFTQKAAGCKLTKEGFVGKVEAPAGKHRVLLEVSDSRGRRTVKELVVTVA